MSPPQGSFLKLWLAVPLWFSLTTQCSSFSKYLFHYITLVCLLVYFLHKRWELSNITHYQRNANQKKTMKYHYTLVRMTAIRKSTNNKCWRVWRKGNPLTLLVGMQASTATMENSVEIP